MDAMLFSLPIAAGVILIVFVFLKRRILFTPSARHRQSAPKWQAQDIPMRRLISAVLPQHEQPAIRKMLSDYGEMNWQDFRRQYAEVIAETEYEEDSFSSDIRGSLLVAWMTEKKLLILCGEGCNWQECRYALEQQGQVTLSIPDKKGKELRQWGEECKKQGKTLLIFRDAFLGSPVCVIDTEQARPLIGKHVSDIIVLDAAGAF